MLAVRVRSSAEGAEAPCFAETVEVLDVAEAALHVVAVEHGLREARIGQWRSDQPEAVPSWVDRGRHDIGTSIRFYVDEQDGPYPCAVEVDAWGDERDKGGRAVRRWRHEPIGSWRAHGAEEASTDLRLVSKTIAMAHDTVAQWDTRNLTKRHYPRLA